VLSEKVIYDFGANTGLNLPYYLQKADKVVAVEANRVLADDLRVRFREAIDDGRLVVVDRAITTRFRDDADLDFYVYSGEKKSGHVLSSLQEPDRERAAAFRRTTVPSTDAHELFLAHGTPFFVKIDLEHHDAVVLRDVLSWPHLPEYLSVEAHDLEVLALLLLARSYQSFQIVDGRTVQSVFADHPVRLGPTISRVDFPKHSAGPFGEDLPGPWLSRTGLVREFGSVGPGWIDVHASLHRAAVETVLGPAVATAPVPPGVLAPVAQAARLAALAIGRLPGAILPRAVPRGTGPRPVQD
jgi:FkbM family methyltransferase